MARRPRGARRPAVLFDRDGTLVHDVPYLADPELLELFTDVAPALRKLVTAGFVLGVVTSQSAVARGLATIDEVEAVNLRLRRLVKEQVGVDLGGVWMCPHHPRFTGPCRCRKPQPGLLLDALTELAGDRSSSWMVGDRTSDLRAGHAAGLRTILLNHHESHRSPGRPPRVPSDVEVFDSMGAVVSQILATTTSSKNG